MTCQIYVSGSPRPFFKPYPPSLPLYLGFVLGQNLYQKSVSNYVCGRITLVVGLNCLKFLLTFDKKSISLIKLKIREAMV